MEPLLVVHIVLTMTGYAGLIAANAWLLALCRIGHGPALADALATWRRMARIFGPLLGLGVLAGFGLAPLTGTPLTAAWLVAVYALVVLALGGQAAVMVPWQMRAQAALARGETLALRPIAGLIALFSVAYVAIASLMVTRPM